MRVMMVSSREIKCGVAEYTRALKRKLHALASVQGFSVPAVTNRKAMMVLAEQINEGDVAHIQYHPDHFGCWRYPWMVHNFNRLLKHIRIPCVVTVHDLTHRLRYRKTGAINFKRVLYNTVAVPIVNRTPYGKFLLGRFLSYADHLIVHTTATKLFLDSLNINSAKVSVLYPGIPEMVSLNKESLRDQLGWRHRTILTVFGFITPYKGYETVLNAMKLLGDHVVLLIAGGTRNDVDDPYLQELRASIISLGLQGRVVVTGHVDGDNIGSMLSAADVILLPYRASIMTGFSYALSYALAAGRPVITSDTPYFCEIEQNYSAIKTFKDGDFRDLASAITKELNRSGAEETAARDYREMWTWKNVAERTYQIYCDVLKRGRAQGGQ